MAKRTNLWTDEERNLIRENYSKLGAHGCASLLHGRTPVAIRKQASDMNLLRARGKYVKRSAFPLPPTNVVEFPIPLAMARLAKFDKVIARAVEDRKAGRDYPSTERGELLRDQPNFVANRKKGWGYNGR